MRLSNLRWIAPIMLVTMLAWMGGTVLAQIQAPLRITITVTSAYQFEPDEITLTVGQPVEITLVNNSPEDQNIRIELGLDEEHGLIEDLRPGETGTVSPFTPEDDGTYYFYSPISDFRERYGLDGLVHVLQADITGTPTLTTTTATATPTPTRTTIPGVPTATRTPLVTPSPTLIVLATAQPTVARQSVGGTPVSRASTQRLPPTGGPLAQGLASLAGIGVMGGLLVALGRFLRRWGR